MNLRRHFLFGATAMLALTAPFIRAATISEPTVPISNYPDEDLDQDGLTNSEEAERGTNPNKTDTDDDGMPDLVDAVGYDPFFTFPAASEGRYAIIDLGVLPAGTIVRSVNNLGQVVVSHSDWQIPDQTWFEIRDPKSAPIRKAGTFYDMNNLGVYLYIAPTTTAPVAHDSPSDPIMTLGYQGAESAVCKSVFGLVPSTHTVISYEPNWETEYGSAIRHSFGNIFSARLLDSGDIVSRYQMFDTEFYYNRRMDMSVWNLPVRYDYGNNSGDVGAILTKTTIKYKVHGLGGWTYTITDTDPPPIGAGNETLTGDWVDSLVFDHSTDWGAKVGANWTFSDGNSVPTTEYPGLICKAVGRLGGQAGLWKSWQSPSTLSLSGPTTGSSIRTGNKGKELIVTKISDRLMQLSAGVFWRNGRVLSNERLIGNQSSWGGLQINAMSDDGTFLAASAKKTADGSSHSVLLVPMDIAVDANRDGVIKFAGNSNSTDPNLAGKPQDKTTEAKPFRFWLNDDYDFREQDTPGAILKDSDCDDITSLRDLEDYTRLAIHIGGLYEGIANGTVKIGLKWKNTSGGTPSIKVFKAANQDGVDENGKNYLNDNAKALEQRAGTLQYTLGAVTGTQPLILPPDFWTGYSEASPKRFLLFEGVTEGKGQLCITIHKADGTLIGEGPGIWLDLLNIKKMYVRAKGTPETNIDAPWEDKPSVVTGYVSDSNGNNFIQPWDEEKTALIYVHGIHGPFVGETAAYLGNINVAETIFKRLWHAGYKGRFAFYKWPALNPAGFFLNGTGFEFNQSEYRAWKYGKGLSEYAASMPNGYKRHVLAHSQGNAVVASAFRDYSLAASTWIITQGAIPISCFDDNPIHLVFPYNTPDLAVNFGYRGYLKGKIAAKVVNFFNTRDRVTGQTWEANQSLFKPTMELSGITRIEYQYFAGSGEVRLQKLFNNVLLSDRAVSDLHESMAMVVKSRSKAIGQGLNAAGEVDMPVDLYSSFGFENEHGSQWDRAIQANVTLYFERLLDEIE